MVAGKSLSYELITGLSREVVKCFVICTIAQFSAYWGFIALRLDKGNCYLSFGAANRLKTRFLKAPRVVRIPVAEKVWKLQCSPSMLLSDMTLSCIVLLIGHDIALQEDSGSDLSFHLHVFR